MSRVIQGDLPGNLQQSSLTFHNLFWNIWPLYKSYWKRFLLGYFIIYGHQRTISGFLSYNLCRLHIEAGTQFTCKAISLKCLENA